MKKRHEDNETEQRRIFIVYIKLICNRIYYLSVMFELKERWNGKTPKFWKKIQRIGVVCGIVGAAIVSAPIALPAAIVSVSGYLVVAGSVTAALSQLTKED